MYNTVSILHMDILTRTRAKTDLFTQPTSLSAHTVISGKEYLEVFHNSLMYFSHIILRMRIFFSKTHGC